ncbi:hypothetical protein AMJ80_09850 [bacterium SM23_31]|nr:MAG: hypothetical protein AMJ80_09850 [bacterium SM23_31]
MKSRNGNKGKFYLNEWGILGTGLYTGVVILDTSQFEELADYGGILYELKKIGIRDGEAYQIDNCGDLLMCRDAYKRCKHIIKKFGVKVVCD